MRTCMHVQLYLKLFRLLVSGSMLALAAPARCCGRTSTGVRDSLDAPLAEPHGPARDRFRGRGNGDPSKYTRVNARASRVGRDERTDQPRDRIGDREVGAGDHADPS